MSPRRAHLGAIAAILPALAWSAPAPAQVQIGLNFTAARFRIDSNFFPPNSMMAAGPTALVQLINGRYSAFDKTTGALLQTSSLNEFWTASGAGYAGNYAFDPRVLYDPFAQRWYASSADGNMTFNPTGESRFLFAVSKTSDPTQGWTGFAIDADSNHAQWADFPMLGYNRDAVVLSANMFAIGDPTYTMTSRAVLVLPKDDLLSAVPSVAGATRLEYSAAGPSSQPLVELDDRSLPTSLWTSSILFDRLTRYDLSGPAGAPTLAPGGQVYMSWVRDPPDARQPAGATPLETYDRRLTSSIVLSGGLVWGAHAVDMSGRSAVHWFKVDEANNVLLQEGFISDANLSFYYPSLAVNGMGDVVIGFSGSGTSRYVSAFAAVGRTEGGLTAFGVPMLLKAGAATFEVLDSLGRNRGGDYSATVVDPNDPLVFWTIQEVVLAPDEWATQIIQITVPEPGVLLIVVAGGGLLILRRGRGRR